MHIHIIFPMCIIYSISFFTFLSLSHLLCQLLCYTSSRALSLLSTSSLTDFGWRHINFWFAIGCPSWICIADGHSQGTAFDFNISCSIYFQFWFQFLDSGMWKCSKNPSVLKSACLLFRLRWTRVSGLGLMPAVSMPQLGQIPAQFKHYTGTITGCSV